MDNLICLAKIYNVSLDEILGTDATVEEIVEELVKLETKEEERKKIIDQNAEDNFGYFTDSEIKRRKCAILESCLDGFCITLTIVAYIQFGLFGNSWFNTDLNFCAASLHRHANIVRAVKERTWETLNGASIFLIVSIYCFLGMSLSIWIWLGSSSFSSQSFLLSSSSLTKAARIKSMPSNTKR